MQPGLTVLWAPAHFSNKTSDIRSCHPLLSHQLTAPGTGFYIARWHPISRCRRTPCAGPAPADPKAGNNGGQVTLSPLPPTGLCSLPSCWLPEEVSLPWDSLAWSLFSPGAPPLKLSKLASLVEPAWWYRDTTLPCHVLDSLVLRGTFQGMCLLPPNPQFYILLLGKKPRASGKWTRRVKVKGGVRLRVI